MGSPGGRVQPRDAASLVQDASRTSLLPTDNNHSASNVPGSMIQSKLVGQFKGFSISPLPKATSAPLTPSRPAPGVAPAQKVSPPKVPDNVVNQNAVPYPIRPAPKVPPTSVGLAVKSNTPPPQLHTNPPPARPNISSPVLDTTTSCAAKELIDGTVPIRPAPSVPQQEAKSNAVRPVSTPMGISNDVCLETKVVKPKDSGSYPTLTRIASFMSKGHKGTHDVKKETNKSMKIDKNSLKNIEISNPILQKEINIPISSLPAGEKAVVMRAQSLRSAASDKKPIATFGSMRLPSNKRPTSIPASNRPSSPPPPRPPSIGVPGYQTPGRVDTMYDDCLNLLTERVAPLANIDEESPSATDNIYAIIEESPIDRRERKEIVLPKKLEYTSPIGEYKSPKPIENSLSAGSAESMGLLGEIVSEIQSRNTDSIYSTSTFNRRKENDDDETASTATDLSSEVDKNQTYVNTPWRGGYNNASSLPKSSASSTTSSSGYLSPINRNFNPKTSDVDKSEVVKVPESTAPYKPYIQRHLGPLASLATKSSQPPSQSSPLSISLGKSNPQALGNKSTMNNRNLIRKDSDSLSSTKPDVVSSCSPLGTKSPDVLGGKTDIKSPTSGNTGGLNAKPGSSFRGGRQPLPAPKPAVIPNVKASITSQPLPAIPTSQKLKPAGGKSFSAKNDSSDNDMNSLANKAASNKPSHVASLQQKFESNKQPRSLTSTKSTVTKNNVNNLKTSVKR